MKYNVMSALCQLPRGLRTSKAAADHRHHALIAWRAGWRRHTATASTGDSAGASAGSHSFAQLMQRR